MTEKAGVPGENPRIQASDYHTFSYTTTADHGDRTRVESYAFWTHKPLYCLN